MRASTSFLRRHNTVAQFIATRPVFGLCEVAERRQGTRFPHRWWEQSGIDWRLARDKAATAAARAGENEAASETPGLGLDAEGYPSTTPGWTAGGTREEAPLGVSGSSGAEWSGAED